MRIRLNYRLEDLQEAVFFVDVEKKMPPRAIRRGIIGWLVFVAMATAMFYFLRATPAPTAGLMAAHEDFPVDPILEFVTTLLPSGVMLLILILSLWQAWRSSRWSPHPLKRRRDGMLATVIVLGIAFLAFGGFLLVNRPTTFLWYATRDQLVLLRIGPWVLVFVLMIVFSLLYRRWQPRKQWLMNPGHRRETEIELDDLGVRVHDSLTLHERKWETFVKARETPGLLLLESEDARRWMIPKRAFNDASEIDRARALIQNKISDSRFLVQPGGFAVLPKPVMPVSEAVQIQTMKCEDSRSTDLND